MENSVVQSADNLMMIVGIIIFVGLVFTKISNIIKLPDVVLYILAGILLGPSMLDLINIGKYPVENQMILSFGAAYILYDGGREIDLKILNKVKFSVLSMATIGVLISTAVVGVAAKYLFDIPMIYALLLGAVVASTDPSVLVPLFKKMNISSKMKQTIISESAFNDAAGAIITFSLIGIIMGGEFSLSETLFDFVKTVVGGIFVGVTLGYISHVLTDEKRRGALNDHPAELMLATVIGAYLISNKLGFSGFMSVFIVGMFCGNKKIFKFWIPEESFQTHLRFKEILTIILRMMIFVLLGTHLDFAVLMKYLLPTLASVFVLIFIARPISVLISVMFDRKAEWTLKEILYLMWIRETGVIPAALAGMLMTAGIQHADMISSVTFATIMITLSFQASTSHLLAKLLKLEEQPSIQHKGDFKNSLTHH